MARKIVVEFAGETSSLDAAFAKVKGTAGGLDKTLKGLVAGAALGTVADQIYDVVGAASNLNESLSKSNQVFGSSGAAINAWADGAATDIGLSKQAALEATSSFGNMFSQLGIGGGTAAQMSEQIVELAADFASFHNADITDVITAQQAAFRGEYDSLQRFLPTINAAAVQQEALKETGKKTTAQLTDQDKALATNTLMLAGAGQAAGDFDRTSDGLANRQRILKAEFENVKAELGEGLLPAITSVTGWIAEHAIPTFESFYGLGKGAGGHNPVRDFITDVAGFGLGGVQGVIRGVGDVSDALGADGVAGELRHAADESDRWRKNLHSTTEELWGAKDATDAVAEATKNDIIAAQKNAQALSDEQKATTALEDAKISLRAADLSLEESQHDLGVAQDAYNQFLETGGIDAEKVAQAQQNLIDVQNDVAKATQGVADAQEAVNKALKPASQKDQAKAGRDVAAAADDVTVAQLDLTDAQDEYAQLVYSGTASEEDLTRARIRANDAVRTLADAQDHLADAQGAQTEVSKQGTTESQAYKDAVQILTDKQGVLKTATDAQKIAQDNLNTSQGLGKDYADKLWAATDNLKNAQLDLDTKTWGAQKAQLALKDAADATTGKIRDQWGNVVGLKDELNNLPASKTIDVEIRTRTTPVPDTLGSFNDVQDFFPAPAAGTFSSPPKKRAMGGPVDEALAYLVGENGPELFIPGRAGTIIPNGRGAGGGDTIINITVNGAIDSASTARQIVGLLKEEQRRSGPLGIG